jgi:hypothetical protein
MQYLVQRVMCSDLVFNLTWLLFVPEPFERGGREIEGTKRPDAVRL